MRLRRLYRSGLASISFISLSPYRFPIGSCCGMLELCSASLVHSPKAAHAHSDGWTTPFPSPTSHIPPPTTHHPQPNAHHPRPFARTATLQCAQFGWTAVCVWASASPPQQLQTANCRLHELWCNKRRMANGTERNAYCVGGDSLDVVAAAAAATPSAPPTPPPTPPPPLLPRSLDDDSRGRRQRRRHTLE